MWQYELENLKVAPRREMATLSATPVQRGARFSEDVTAANGSRCSSSMIEVKVNSTSDKGRINLWEGGSMIEDRVGTMAKLPVLRSRLGLRIGSRSDNANAEHLLHLSRLDITLA